MIQNLFNPLAIIHLTFHGVMQVVQNRLNKAYFKFVSTLLNLICTCVRKFKVRKFTSERNYATDVQVESLRKKNFAATVSFLTISHKIVHHKLIFSKFYFTSQSKCRHLLNLTKIGRKN